MTKKQLEQENLELKSKIKLLEDDKFTIKDNGIFIRYGDTRREYLSVNKNVENQITFFFEKAIKIIPNGRNSFFVEDF